MVPPNAPSLFHKLREYDVFIRDLVLQPLTWQTTPRTLQSTPHSPSAGTLLNRPPLHQLLQPQILPRRLFPRLRCPRDPKSSMLIWYDIVFVLRVRRLMVRWHVDFFVGKLRGAVELFEEVGDAGLIHVDVGVGGIFGL